MSPRTCHEHRGPLPCPACNARLIPPPAELLDEIRSHLAAVAAKNGDRTPPRPKVGLDPKETR